MIHEELFEISGKQFKKTYSDEFFIKQVQTEIVYEEAIDLVPCAFTYEETDIPLPEPEPEPQPE